ncbi:MAG TPA: YihY/virulence factor BrkB family protein [Pseudonocardiaceae bacterium]|nr:YihY/virulence factor BrkB family protein [Pseudonocardiaceae bacterium]
MPQPTQADAAEAPPTRKGAWPLVLRTATKAWDGNIFSEAAEAAFWQTLSLPPLLLGLLGSLGYLGDWFGPQIVSAVQDKIIGFCRTVFSSNVVETIIQPTVSDILTKSHSEIASFGFLLSLWAGSSAMSSFVDAITVAYQQYGVRNEVLQRLFALLLYLIGLVLAIIGLPVLALGPNFLPKVFPEAWQHTVASIGTIFYYPVVAVLLVLALATLYKVALPRRLPWYRGVPGSVLAMVVFLLASIGIRIYLLWIGKTGYTYGALAAPIAFLLFTFFIGLAIVIGAYFNSAIQEMWPAKPTRRARRKWRRLEMVRTTERINAEGGSRADKKAAEAESRAEESEPEDADGDTGEDTDDPADAR